jgi:hypothetical protein
MSNKRLTDALGQLIALRGTHDQTMRTRAISIMFGGASNGTETERFLEFMIAWLETQIRLHNIALIDQE